MVSVDTPWRSGLLVRVPICVHLWLMRVSTRPCPCSPVCPRTHTDDSEAADSLLVETYERCIEWTSSASKVASISGGGGGGFVLYDRASRRRGGVESPRIHRVSPRDVKWRRVRLVRRTATANEATASSATNIWMLPWLLLPLRWHPRPHIVEWIEYVYTTVRGSTVHRRP